jgi:hypothetical protein
MKWLICILLLLPCNSLALEDSQRELIVYAHSYASEYGWGETVASILYQESKAGFSGYRKYGVVVGDRSKSGGYKSLGVMQIQLETAKDILRWFPHLCPEPISDTELSYRLLADDKFSIRLGTWYFIKLYEVKGSWREAILAYNIGPSGTLDINDYVSKVLKWRKWLLKEVIND